MISGFLPFFWAIEFHYTAVSVHVILKIRNKEEDKTKVVEWVTQFFYWTLVSYCRCQTGRYVWVYIWLIILYFFYSIPDICSFVMMTMKNIINPQMLLDFKILEWDDCRMEMINTLVFKASHSHKHSFPTICFICALYVTLKLWEHQDELWHTDWSSHPPIFQLPP